jgi:hypothetical protein
MYFTRTELFGAAALGALLLALLALRWWSG